MLVLGCVKEVRLYELVVTLPGDIPGIVPITNISQAYTEQLQRVADGDTEGTEVRA